MSEESRINYRTDEELMAETLVRRAIIAQIPIELVPMPREKFQSLLDEKWYENHGNNLSDIIDDIYNPESKWPVSHTAVFIDGGTETVRLQIGYACLYRAIVNTSNGTNGTALCKRSQELVLSFNEFGDERIRQKEAMQRIQCLFLMEIDLLNPPKPAPIMGNLFFDELVQSRLVANRATIYSLIQADAPSYATFSRTLDAMIRSPLSPTRRIYRLRCRD